MTYDAENRLVEVKRGSTVVDSYVYDGYTAQVKSTVSGTTTVRIGGHFEWTVSTAG